MSDHRSDFELMVSAALRRGHLTFVQNGPAAFVAKLWTKGASLRALDSLIQREGTTPKRALRAVLEAEGKDAEHERRR